jgi:hypothetical protein
LFLLTKYFINKTNKFQTRKGEKNMASIKPVSEKSLAVLEYLRGLYADANVTAADIAAALGMTTKSANGVITGGLQRKGLTVRVPAQVEVTNEDGTTKYEDVKFIKLTPAGQAYDHEAAVVEAEAEKAAKAAEKDAE